MHTTTPHHLPTARLEALQWRTRLAWNSKTCPQDWPTDQRLKKGQQEVDLSNKMERDTFLLVELTNSRLFCIYRKHLCRSDGMLCCHLCIRKPFWLSPCTLGFEIFGERDVSGPEKLVGPCGRAANREFGFTSSDYFFLFYFIFIFLQKCAIRG